MSDRMTYRDYLVWTAAHSAACLAEAIRIAMDMRDDEYSISHLEHKLDVVKTLVEYRNFNPEVVEARDE